MSRAHANIVAGEGDESDSDDEEKERSSQPRHWQKQTKLPMQARILNSVL